MSASNLLIAIILFSAIILFHELGHFLLAKANKVGVIEFSLGMGPRLISFAKTQKGPRVTSFRPGRYFEEHTEYEGHTIYSLKILPFGGSCMMLGEMEEIDNENAFGKKSVWARMAVIFAGPFFNFILAFVLALIVIGSVGYDTAYIHDIEAGSPMEQSGLQDGDVITNFDGKSIVVNRELQFYLQFHPLEKDTPVDITVTRDGKEIKATMTPALMKNHSNGKESYRLGFSYGGPRTKSGFLDTLKYSAYEVKFWIFTTLESLGQMISGNVSAKEVSGPVGIIKTVGDVVNEAERGGVSMVLLNVCSMGILLTANLGVMNLLPIPALDGGRLLFLIIEAIRRKPLPEKFENYVNVGGFVLLMGLMVVILINDVLKFIPH